jgi:hypothetical protein
MITAQARTAHGDMDKSHQGKVSAVRQWNQVCEGCGIVQYSRGGPAKFGIT